MGDRPQQRAGPGRLTQRRATGCPSPGAARRAFVRSASAAPRDQLLIEGGSQLRPRVTHSLPLGALAARAPEPARVSSSRRRRSAESNSGRCLVDLSLEPADRVLVVATIEPRVAQRGVRPRPVDALHVTPDDAPRLDLDAHRDGASTVLPARADQEHALALGHPMLVAGLAEEVVAHGRAQDFERKVVVSAPSPAPAGQDRCEASTSAMTSGNPRPLIAMAIAP